MWLFHTSVARSKGQPTFLKNRSRSVSENHERRRNRSKGQSSDLRRQPNEQKGSRREGGFQNQVNNVSVIDMEFDPDCCKTFDRVELAALSRLWGLTGKSPRSQTQSAWLY